MLHFNAHKMNLNGPVVGFHNLIPIYFQIKLTLLLKHERMARSICSFVEVVHITLKVPLLKGNWNTQRNSLSLRYNASCQTSDYLFNPIKTSFPLFCSERNLVWIDCRQFVIKHFFHFRFSSFHFRSVRFVIFRFCSFPVEIFFATAVQLFQDLTPAFLKVLLHRILVGELLIAVQAGVICVGLVARQHMPVQFFLRL